MESDKVFVVIGGGEAGGKAVQTLREEGFGGKIVLVAAEDRLPYERPPLSKSYLQGEPYKSEGSLQDEQWYQDHDIDLRLGCRAVSVNRADHEVQLDDGTRLAYDKLLIATGAQPRTLDVPGADLAGVHYLRTMKDADALGNSLESKPRVVIVGAGWIGLEVAAVARQRGCDVTVIEPNDIPLQASMGSRIGKFFAQVHREHGVSFSFGQGVTAFTGTSTVAAVVTEDGTETPAHVVVVGVGVRPDVALVDADLLADDGGVLVDEQMRTADPDVFAAGDIASVDNALYGHRIRVEHWANALMGGKIAAQSMLGRDSEFDPAPFFFTDQYDLGMEYAGWVDAQAAGDPVIRGDMDASSFHAFWLTDGVVVAGMHVNSWDEGIAPVQKLIRGKVRVDPTRLADTSVPLSDLIPKD
ncbi:NAD(P)/FAD-dependent oxidoreductase [Nakamurella antarctica]|uniref:NAD(P)/FAD-dependent oxidoreductase n=1 Tax=Nakamurella antarctica TaxID=1902245 RepID=A0A3G8ZNI1_9ACTN|nr:FAD-dependent oxidoreductase [Nakamurella antarctica]AZI58803.1 NAD(P)/FAD-dependent oxidoreductase [Nakamurella antarctica]